VEFVGAAPKAIHAAKPRRPSGDRRGHRRGRPGRSIWSADIAAAMTSRPPSRRDAMPDAATASRSATARPRRTRTPRALGRRRPPSSLVEGQNRELLQGRLSEGVMTGSAGRAIGSFPRPRRSSCNAPLGPPRRRSRPARLSSVSPTCQLAGPSAFSRIASALRYKGSASGYLPSSSYSVAKSL
jgi:hypothetical protein